MRKAFALFLVLTTAMVGLYGSGCGGSSAGGTASSRETTGQSEPAGSGESSGSQQAYGDVLRGLREAAVAEKTYRAVRRAEGLPPEQRAAIRGFCEMVWQIDINDEASKLSLHPYIDNRLLGRAAIKLERSPDGLEAAVRKLSNVVGLRHLNEKRNRQYKKACFN